MMKGCWKVDKNKKYHKVYENIMKPLIYVLTLKKKDVEAGDMAQW